MNINDNEKLNYLIKQLYNYWVKKKAKEFVAEQSVIWPNLSDNEIIGLLDSLTSKTFSISYHLPYPIAAYDRYGNPEYNFYNPIPGKFHIILTDEFEDFASDYCISKNKPSIFFNKTDDTLVINNDFKIKFGLDNKNTCILRVLFNQSNKKKNWEVDEICRKINKLIPNRMEGTTPHGFFGICLDVNKTIRLKTDGIVPKLLKASDYYCQLNPEYTYLN